MQMSNTEDFKTTCPNWEGGADLLSVAEPKVPLTDNPIGKMCQDLPLARAEKVGAGEQ